MWPNSEEFGGNRSRHAVSELGGVANQIYAVVVRVTGGFGLVIVEPLRSAENIKERLRSAGGEARKLDKRAFKEKCRRRYTIRNALSA